jgi:hypothetical protein
MLNWSLDICFFAPLRTSSGIQHLRLARHAFREQWCCGASAATMWQLDALPRLKHLCPHEQAGGHEGAAESVAHAASTGASQFTT